MNRWLVPVLLFCSILLIRCGSGDSSGLPGPVDTPGAPDTAADTATAPDTVPDTVPDTAPDTVPDTAPDTAPDTVPDTASDVVPDTAPDTASDTAPDTVTVSDTRPDIPPPPCGGAPPARVEVDPVLVGGELTLTLPPCSEALVPFHGAAGSLLALSATGSPELGPLELAITYPDTPSWDTLLASGSAPAGRSAWVDIVVPRAGELFLLVRHGAVEAEGEVRVALECRGACEGEATRYPIVLVHGWTGWSSVGPYDYFYGVPETLRDKGYVVFVASLDPYNSIEVRSEQLAPQIDALLLEARARKVDIIAHSQGGLDARRLISTLGYGDRVSALVTISTPHYGTPLCDVALGLLPGFGEDILALLLEWLGATVVGSESDAIASFESLTEDYVRNDFNPFTPNDDRVAYISYAGKTCLFGITCGDVCDVEIRWSHNILNLVGGDNDGIIPTDNARWGDFRGVLPADHFDEVGQLLGVTNRNFDHEDFYLGLARDLAAEGH